MRRRDFVGLVSGTAIWPLVASAQSTPALKRVVVLSAASDPSSRLTIFRQQVSELGYVEGRNIAFDIRSAEGHLDHLPMMAEALVREGSVDVILAESTPAAVAAHKATRTIPIVALVGVDPVASGLAESLARPGGNVTGITIFADEANAKRVQLVRELAPHAVRLGAIMAIRGQLNVVTLYESGRNFGFVVEVIVANPDHLDETLSPSVVASFDAFLIVPDVVLSSRKDEIIRLIAQTNKPAVFSERQWADSGGLVTFGPDIREASRHWASQLIRVLNGQKPKDLPFERPTKFELRINMRTARTIGIEIPSSLLVRADQVIE
jgi:putative ABC transport system substrate-binding protein